MTRINHFEALNTKFKTIRERSLLIYHYYHTCSAHMVMCERRIQEIYLKKKKNREKRSPDHIITRTEFQRLRWKRAYSYPFLFSLLLLLLLLPFLLFYLKSNLLRAMTRWLVIEAGPTEKQRSRPAVRRSA